MTETLITQEVQRVAANGTYQEREMVYGRVARAHWGMDNERPEDPVETMVQSMRDLARRGKEERDFVSSIARRHGIHIAAQFGEESLRKAQVDYGDKTSDFNAIRRFGSLVKWAMGKPGDVSAIASITIQTVNCQLAYRNQVKPSK